MQSFISNSSRASSLTHVTSCVNAPGINSNKVATTPTLQNSNTQGNNSVHPLLTTTASQDNFEAELKKNEEKHLIYEPKRLLSQSSTTSSSSSSSGLDAADKEIAAISLPKQDETNDYSFDQKQNIDCETKLHTPPNSVALPSLNGLLLSKVDIIDNENDNDIDNSLINSKKFPKREEQKNWPNPPSMFLSNVPNKSIMSAQLPNDLNLIHELMHMMRTQQKDIEALKQQQTMTLKSLKSHFDSTLKTMRQQSLSSSAASSLTINEENLGAIMNQTLITQVIPKLEIFVKDEIRQSIQPQIIKIVEPFREQIPRELAEKLSATENLLKDSIAKMFKSKGFLDSISQSVGNGIQSTIVNAYRDSFQKVILPSFEKSCQSMYQQINATFKKGSDDYVQELENYLKQQRKIYEDQQDPIINQLKQYNDNFQSSLTQFNTTLINNLQTQFEQNLRTSNAILQDTIISSVKAIIKEELNVAMRDQQQHLPEHLITLMRQSGTVTPVTFSYNEIESKQMRINNFLQKEQFNEAFQSALCASDLNLLMNVCEAVSPGKLFEAKPCPLQQPVLLSLIQQLSQDLNANTDLKLKYIEEAIMSLDLSNILTREHMPAIINVLQQKLLQYINAHPNEKVTKSMRMLLMASQSLLSR